MFICFPWKFTIRHLFPESPALGDLCTKSHIINGMVCFPLTWSCQIEVVQLLSWGKTGSCFSAPDWGLQSERKLMEVCKPFFRTYFVHNINHLFLPCIMREAFCPKQLGGPCQVTNRHLGRIRNDGAGSYFQYPSPEQTQSCCSLAFEIREEREAEVFWECWWCQILRFGGGGFLLLITSEWPHFMLPESCLWNFNMCDLLWE